MNRQDFLYQLAEALMDLPPEERISALKYYEEYFEDAGPDQEQEVLRELGSPQEVARTILADYAQREPGSSAYYGGSYQSPPPSSYTPPLPRSERSVWTTVLIVVAVLIFGWPLLIGLFGMVIGLIGALIGLTVAAVVGCFGLLIGGIVAVVGGIIGMATFPAGGLLQLSAGLASTGFGLMFLLLGIWLVGKVLPRFIRWIVYAVRRLFRIDKGGNSQ